MKLEEKIKKVYPFIDEKVVAKLAMENARYMISVFTPTKMAHTLSFRQMNYILHWFDEFIKNVEDNDFNCRIKNAMQDFNNHLKQFYVPELEPKLKRRRLSLISKRNFNEFFDESYSANYKLSFAGLAQAQRHRTINYAIKPPSLENGFFVPPILRRDDDRAEWLKDLESVKQNYPQALLLNVNERGIYEDFISKASERLCGRAQLEIRIATKELLMRYIEATKHSNPEVHISLLPYSMGAKCTFPNYTCREPCWFRAKSLEMLV